MTKEKKKRHKKLNIFRLLFLISLLVVMVASGIVIGLVSASIRDMPDISVEAINYNASTLIYDQNDKLITKIGIENRTPVKLQEVPDIVKEAFIAVEDVRFYQHHGIDLRGIARAAWQDIITGSIREGASTITQQVVRDIYLTKEQNFKRKIQEAILALQLERKLSKKEILELYINRIYFGEGAYGIESAAQTYFGIPASKLNLKEAAFLAGLPQAPSSYSPYNNKELAINRRNVVLNSMLRYNYINQEEYNKTINSDLGTLDAPAAKEYPYPYYIDYVTEQLVKKYGEAQVFKGGLIVHIAVDPKIQKIAEETLSDDNSFPTSDIQGAVVVLDYQTGYIKALVGGREHTHKRQWNRATQTLRQPGSAFKPIIAYAPAIELKAKGPASIVDDTPITVNGWSPHNSNNSFRGLITLRTALTHSVNIAAVKLLQQVTVPEAKNFAHRLGITTLDPTHDVGLSMALGGLYKGVTPLELAGAYGTFANQGVYIKPRAIIKVEKPDGTILEDAEDSVKYAAMKPSTAYLMTDMLQSVVKYGTGTSARLNRPTAGKTGTTEDGRDTWFAGYTPELACIVWMGYDEPKPTPYFGGQYPAQIWRKIISKSLEGMPNKPFPRPNGLVSATVDSKSGLLPGPNTPQEDMVTDLFAAGTIPQTRDKTHVLVEICAVSGELAGNYCPDRITKVMVKLPYTVPSFVADYKQRVPTKTCSLHDSGTSLHPDNRQMEDVFNITGNNNHHQKDKEKKDKDD